VLTLLLDKGLVVQTQQRKHRSPTAITLRFLNKKMELQEIVNTLLATLSASQQERADAERRLMEVRSSITRVLACAEEI